LLAIAVVVLLIGLFGVQRWRAGEADSGADARANASDVRSSIGETATPSLEGLDFSARLEGRVLDADDVAIPGAQVCVVPASLAELAELSFRPRCVTADDSGWFAID